MRITTKGQVTIPQEIREELGLLPNTEVTFDRIEDADAALVDFAREPLPYKAGFLTGKHSGAYLTRTS